MSEILILIAASVWVCDLANKRMTDAIRRAESAECALDNERNESALHNERYESALSALRSERTESVEDTKYAERSSIAERALNSLRIEYAKCIARAQNAESVLVFANKEIESMIKRASQANQESETNKRLITQEIERTKKEFDHLIQNASFRIEQETIRANQAIERAKRAERALSALRAENSKSAIITESANSAGVGMSAESAELSKSDERAKRVVKRADDQIQLAKKEGRVLCPEEAKRIAEKEEEEFQVSYRALCNHLKETRHMSDFLQGCQGYI